MQQSKGARDAPEYALNSLIKLSKRGGYVVKWIPGRGGNFSYWNKLIEVGQDLNSIEKIIVLSHEFGHALEWAANFPGTEEIILMVKFLKIYRVSEQYLRREEKAWEFAELTLKNLQIFDTIEDNFNIFKSECLQAYNEKHQEAKGLGKDKPGTEEFRIALEDVMDIK